MTPDPCSLTEQDLPVSLTDQAVPVSSTLSSVLRDFNADCGNRQLTAHLTKRQGPMAHGQVEPVSPTVKWQSDRTEVHCVFIYMHELCTYTIAVTHSQCAPSLPG
jgi:hypothetical protein